MCVVNALSQRGYGLIKALYVPYLKLESEPFSVDVHSLTIKSIFSHPFHPILQFSSPISINYKKELVLNISAKNFHGVKIASYPYIRERSKSSKLVSLSLGSRCNLTMRVDSPPRCDCCLSRLFNVPLLRC